MNRITYKNNSQPATEKYAPSIVMIAMNDFQARPHTRTTWMARRSVRCMCVCVYFHFSNWNSELELELELKPKHPFDIFRM